MNRQLPFLLFATLPLISVCVFPSVASAEPSAIKYQKLHLTDKFHCEGAFYADFNRDGNLDVVSGPYWYPGPDFQTRYEIHEPQEYNPLAYSENFLTYTDDFNSDGWPDILYVPFPGKDAFWYENPGSFPAKGQALQGSENQSDSKASASKPRHWKAHSALKNVGNESPVWTDVNGDGRNDLVFNIDGYLGYGTWDPKQPEQPWVFHRVSGEGDYQRFTHGVGAGDLNDDGLVDIVEANGWWEQPAKPRAGEPWIWHPYKFADAAAQMMVYDLDGDGLKDVINAWHCHLYGLVWHKQVRSEDGTINFQQQTILPPKPDLKSSDLRISQMHALTLADMNGDGRQDLVTGKRYWAHGPTGDVEADAPAVLGWFQAMPSSDNKKLRFDFHEIDNDSGVGTQVTAVDLNGDKTPDLVVGNKKGTFVFLSQRK